MAKSDRKTLREKRREIVAEINRNNFKRCPKCRLQQKDNDFVYDCCDAAKKIRRLGDELLQLKSNQIVDETEPKKQLLNHLKWRKIAEENGIPYSTYRNRVYAGIPMDIAATYTREGIFNWRQRHDQQSSASW